MNIVSAGSLICRSMHEGFNVDTVERKFVRGQALTLVAREGVGPIGMLASLF